MTEVACFCGSLYSFDGGGGACPKCGEYAAVMAGPAFNSTGRSRPRQTAAQMNEVGQNGQTAGTRRDRAAAPARRTASDLLTAAREPEPIQIKGGSTRIDGYVQELKQHGPDPNPLT
jgi:Zn-dependent M28 family amino/carboxypeptidase